MPAGTAERDAAVLEFLRTRSATRPQIADGTGMSKPTVSAAIASLEQVGLVTEDGHITGSTGRSPVIYRLHRTAHLVAGVDIGGVNTRAAIADIRGTILVEDAQPTQPERVIDQVVDMLAAIRTQCAHTLGLSEASLSAVVLSTPGVTTDHTHVRLAYNLTPVGTIDFEPLFARLGAPFRVENNVNLAAIAESRVGVARDTDTFVHISVGAGIGVGIIDRGRLLRGFSGAAGEIAHLPVGPQALSEEPAEQGNFETTSAAGGLMRRADAQPWPDQPPADVAELFARAQDGDDAARNLVADEGRRIGLAVVAIRTLLDPEMVVLGGGIGRNELLVAPVEDVCRRLLPTSCPIVTTQLADRGSLIGAVTAAADDAWDAIMADPGNGPRRDESPITPATHP